MNSNKIITDKKTIEEVLFPVEEQNQEDAENKLDQIVETIHRLCAAGWPTEGIIEIKYYYKDIQCSRTIDVRRMSIDARLKNY